MGGKAMAPYSIGLWVTEACDLNCPMCWVDSGRSDADSAGKPLEKEDWFRLIDELVEWMPRLTITGGEPLLVQYTVDLVRYAAGGGFRVNLGTNGTRLKDYAKELVMSGLQDLSISLDGPRDVHDNLRGKQGAFDAVGDGVRKVVEMKGKAHRALPFIRLNCTLTNANQGCLRDVVTLAENWGVDSLSFQHMWYTTPETLHNHNDQFRAVFGQESPNLSGFLVNGWAPDPTYLAKELHRLSGNSGNHLPMYVYPELDALQIQKFYHQSDAALREKCRSRWFRTDIKPNGDVSPCLSFIVGNIREASFGDIWNNDRYRMFRRQILTGLFPGCYRCCGLFSD